MDFGVLTLATPGDYQKAIGLALSVRLSNPGVPIAVACSPAIGVKLAPFFDIIIEENATLKGFVHKVHLDRYSPFENTFFFDSDVLIFRNLNKKFLEWTTQPYSVCGLYKTEGVTSFSMDRAKVLKIIGKSKLAAIDGAGHAFFRKPECGPLFDLARQVTADYSRYAPGARYADEDVMAIAMTLLDIEPMPYDDFFARYLSARRGTMHMDAVRSDCHFIYADDGLPFAPYMVHFAANEAPWAYAKQLRELFRHFGVDDSGLMMNALEDVLTTNVVWPFKDCVKKLLSFKNWKFA